MGEYICNLEIEGNCLNRMTQCYTKAYKFYHIKIKNLLQQRKWWIELTGNYRFKKLLELFGTAKWLVFGIYNGCIWEKE